MIEVQNLRKTYMVHKKAPGFWGSVKSLIVREKYAKHAVNDVSFQIGEGEIVGLIGANGAGKTTLVKMLAGIIHPTGGKARVLGHDPWERANDFRRQIALIMGQKAQLWWDLPAADCFLLLKEIYRLPDEQFHETLEELTTVLDIKKELNVQIRRLSLGERMKMELIAALLHRPRVVFLDEPTIGLDLSAQHAIREFILRYQQKFKPAVILTSHYMEDIERLCKRIMIIRQGEIVYDGSLEQVVHTYAKRKVVTAHLRDDKEFTLDREKLEKIGRMEDAGDREIRLHVPREDVASAAAHLVNEYPVVDLNIEEVEIGEIIEAIMTDKQHEDD
ncbi:ATP-binding cassette domain-containing protein [bacterium]|nr:ATP-binding cassette domain-containing protein [bacterium]